MIRQISKNEIRERVHIRIRKKLRGTTERPRLTVFRSTAHIYAQVIDDVKGVTLVAASSTEKAGDGAAKVTGGNLAAPSPAFSVELAATSVTPFTSSIT